MRQASEKGVQIIAFPELSVTGYTCLDLFAQQTLLDGAEEALLQLVSNTADLDILTIVGVPLRTENRLINAAVVFQKGAIRGVVPKTYLPNYKEFQEQRWFTSATELRESTISIGEEEYPMGSHLLFRSGRLTAGIEICEDLWVPVPPSSLLAMEGANIIFNLSASNELIGKHAYLSSLICQQSARCMAGYVYASSGFGESSTDLVFAGNGIIAENGNLLAESPRFTMEEQLVISEIDIETLQNDRQVNTSFMYGTSGLPKEKAQVVDFQVRISDGFSLTRPVDPHPFTPSGEALKERCEEIFHIQVAGLAKRLVHAHAQTAVVGISGGLDSTLALLVTVMTFDALKMPRGQIIGITMPGFGTTDRTYNNALELMRGLGVTIREIPIRDACTQHFQDIGLDPGSRGVMVVFGGHVIAGTRAKKNKTISYDAFASVNFPALALVQGDRLVRYVPSPWPTGPVEFGRSLSPRVFLLKLTPGLSPDLIPEIFRLYDCVIVESFGVGGIPQRLMDAFAEGLGDYDKTHKVLILTTQVTYEGSDVGIYEVGKRVKNRFRFLEAHDMTIEAVVTKIMWLLAQDCDSFDQLQQRFYRQVNFDTFYH